MSVDEFEHYLINKETPKIIIPAYPTGIIPVESYLSPILISRQQQHLQPCFKAVLMPVGRLFNPVKLPDYIK